MDSFFIRCRLWALYALYGYALFFALSIAIGNVFLGLSLLFFLFSMKAASVNCYMPKKYVISLLAFFVPLFFMAIFSDNPIEGFNRFMRFFAKLFPLFLVLLLVKEEKSLKRIFLCMTVSIGGMVSTAVWQGLHGDFHAAAFFSNPMYFAGLIVQYIPMVWLCIFYSSVKMQQRCWLAIFCIAMAGTLFNGTRGAWLTLLIVLPLGLILWGKEKKKIYSVLGVSAIFITVIFLCVPQFSQRVGSLMDMKYQSNAERLLIWKSSWAMFEDHPLIGVGLGEYETYYRTKYISNEAKERGLGHAHNNILQLLAETGILGAGTFCYMMGSFIFYSLQKWWKFQRIEGLFFSLATLGLMLQGLTETNIANSVVMQYYYFLMGLYLVSIKNQETSKT